MARRQPATWAYLLASRADLQGAAERWAKIVRHCRQHPSEPPLTYCYIEAEELYTERFSGRPEAEKLLRSIEAGDSLIVATTGELGGTVEQISMTLRYLLRRGLRVNLLDAADAPLQCSQFLADAAVTAVGPSIVQAAERNRRRSIQNALAERKAKRLPLGPRCPLGLRVVHRRGLARVVRDWAFERWAARIFHWQNEGVSLAEIHRRLLRRRARGPEGRPWSYWSVVRAYRWQKLRYAAGETVPRAAAP